MNFSLQKAKAIAKAKEKMGSKPHTCSVCKKRLGMSEAYLTGGVMRCKKHK